MSGPQAVSSSPVQAERDWPCITIHTLAIDAVEKLDFGHGGAPMDLAPVAFTLWQDFLSYHPDRYARCNRVIIGMHMFAAPLKNLLNMFNFTSSIVLEAGNARIARSKAR